VRNDSSFLRATRCAAINPINPANSGSRRRTALRGKGTVMNKHTPFPFSAEEVARALGGEASGRNKVLAPGPGHSTKDRSLSVAIDPAVPDGFSVHSFAGDDWQSCKDHVREKLGYKWEPQLKVTTEQMLAQISSRSRGIKEQANTQPTPPTAYVYRKADGTQRLRVNRTQSKGFWQEHWDGEQWVKGAGSEPHVPYRLSELLTAEHETVLIVEGEKDADNVAALGFTATTNAGGAGKWNEDLNQYFAGRDVYILPDNDEAGEKHVTKVSASLKGVAREIRVLRLPGLPEKGDVSDWIAAGGTADELADLLRHAPTVCDGVEVEAPKKKPRFVFETTTDLRTGEEEEYLIEGFVPERSVGLFWGRWGSFKTFAAFDWALQIAYGFKDWHGAKLPGEAAPVLIIAREGKKGFIKRIDAFKKHHGLTEDPAHLIFMRSAISFLDNVGFAELKRAIEGLGMKFRLILVDTVGRVLSGEDMAKEQPITLFMERLQQVGELTGATSIGVHHENKSGDANGSMYFQNNSDFMFSVTRDGDKLAGKLTCVKQKDGEDHWSKEITLVKVELEGGKSSLVVDCVSDCEAAPEGKKIGWTKGLKLIRDAIDEAILNNCVTHRPMGDGPVVRAAPLKDAREAHKRKYVNTGDGDRDTAERGAWSKNFKKARNDGVIGGETTKGGQELVWIVREEEL
jgi:AAA domain